MAIANSIQAEINDLVHKIYRIADNAKVESRQAFRIAAKPLIQDVQRRIPVSKEPHHRYLGGELVATYYPGNLKRSIKALTFRRSAAIFVGPKLDKSGSRGVFKGTRTDGYYAHMVEFGTINQRPQPFMRPAAESTGPVALRIAANELRRKINNYATRYAQVRGRT